MRIIYLDLDALRPDHLGCYGYHRNTSPHIDSLAARGVRFEKYHTCDAPCLPSRTAFYTGMFGIRHGAVNHTGRRADLFHEGPERHYRDMWEKGGLAGQLQKAGYHTAQISPFGSRHSARQFYCGFHEIHDTGGGGMDQAAIVTPVVLDWLSRRARDDNWYLHINYWDIHTPYRVPLGYGEPFANDPLPDWITDEVLQKHLTQPGPHTAWDVNMYSGNEDRKFPRHPGELRDRAQLRRMIDGYDTAVRYVDDQIGLILQALRDAGVEEETTIIVSADHGENLGELGLYGEHGTADQITTRVPLIVKGPVVPSTRAGAVDRGLHYNIDWSPTLMDLLGRDRPGHWDGRSFAPSLTEGADTGRDALVLSLMTHSAQRSVRFGPWLYIRTYHDNYQLFPREMLFHIDDDPHEQHNLADERRDICDRALAVMADWHDDNMQRSLTGTDPLWEVMHEGGPAYSRGRLAEYIPRLEATGRGWAVAELKKRHPREFIR